MQRETACYVMFTSVLFKMTLFAIPELCGVWSPL